MNKEEGDGRTNIFEVLLLEGKEEEEEDVLLVAEVVRLEEDGDDESVEEMEGSNREDGDRSVDVETGT
jgi:hypothetical protein